MADSEGSQEAGGSPTDPKQSEEQDFLGEEGQEQENAKDTSPKEEGEGELFSGSPSKMKRADSLLFSPKTRVTSFAHRKQGDRLYSKKDFKGAAKMYEKAASKGDYKAMKKIGEMYLLGEGVDADNSRALKFLYHAAECADVGGNSKDYNDIQCSIAKAHIREDVSLGVKLFKKVLLAERKHKNRYIFMAAHVMETVSQFYPNHRRLLKRALPTSAEQILSVLVSQGTAVEIPDSARLDPGDIVLDQSKPLGSGAFGNVFKGTFKGKPCAIKIWKTELGEVKTAEDISPSSSARHSSSKKRSSLWGTLKRSTTSGKLKKTNSNANPVNSKKTAGDNNITDVTTTDNHQGKESKKHHKGKTNTGEDESGAATSKSTEEGAESSPGGRGNTNSNTNKNNTNDTRSNKKSHKTISPDNLETEEEMAKWHTSLDRWLNSASTRYSIVLPDGEEEADGPYPDFSIIDTVPEIEYVEVSHHPYGSSSSSSSFSFSSQEEKEKAGRETRERQIDTERGKEESGKEEEKRRGDKYNKTKWHEARKPSGDVPGTRRSLLHNTAAALTYYGGDDSPQRSPKAPTRRKRSSSSINTRDGRVSSAAPSGLSLASKYHQGGNLLFPSASKKGKRKKSLSSSGGNTKREKKKQQQQQQQEEKPQRNRCTKGSFDKGKEGKGKDIQQEETTKETDNIKQREGKEESQKKTKKKHSQALCPSGSSHQQRPKEKRRGSTGNSKKEQCQRESGLKGEEKQQQKRDKYHRSFPSPSTRKEPQQRDKYQRSYPSKRTEESGGKTTEATKQEQSRDEYQQFHSPSPSKSVRHKAKSQESLASAVARDKHQKSYLSGKKPAGGSTRQPSTSTRSKYQTSYPGSKAATQRGGEGGDKSSSSKKQQGISTKKKTARKELLKGSQSHDLTQGARDKYQRSYPAASEKRANSSKTSGAAGNTGRDKYQRFYPSAKQRKEEASAEGTARDKYQKSYPSQKKRSSSRGTVILNNTSESSNSKGRRRDKYQRSYPSKKSASSSDQQPQSVSATSKRDRYQSKYPFGSNSAEVGSSGRSKGKTSQKGPGGSTRYRSNLPVTMQSKENKQRGSEKTREAKEEEEKEGGHDMVVIEAGNKRVRIAREAFDRHIETLIRQALEVGAILFVQDLLGNKVQGSVIELYGVAETPRGLGMVMELAPYGTLGDWIIGEKSFTSPLALGTKLDILYQISMGMYKLHKGAKTKRTILSWAGERWNGGIIHSDLHRNNILVTHRDPFRVKITDFGLAKLVTKKRAWIHDELGTAYVSHLAPEIEENQMFGRPSDVYNFGILAWELLTEQEVADYKGSGTPPLPAEMDPGLKDLLLWCWKSPVSKRATMIEVSEVLKNKMVNNMITTDFGV